MTTSQITHNQQIIEQFTKQAVPFAQMSEHTEVQAMNLLIEAVAPTPEDTILDVACGPGLVVCTLAHAAKTVTGIDLTPGMIEQAKLLQSQKELSNVQWQVGDVNRLPFADNTFSRVVTRYSFHHFLEPEAVLAEMIRVCKPGGRIVVMDVYTFEEQEKADRYNACEILRDPSHTRALKLSEMKQLMPEAGLQDTKVEFCRLAVGLDTILSASFPNPGAEDKIRQMFTEDLETNAMGFEPHLDNEGKIRFSFPIVIISGVKPI